MASWRQTVLVSWNTVSLGREKIGWLSHVSQVRFPAWELNSSIGAEIGVSAPDTPFPSGYFDALLVLRQLPSLERCRKVDAT